jgi:hypothetical protein
LIVGQTFGLMRAVRSKTQPPFTELTSIGAIDIWTFSLPQQAMVNLCCLATIDGEDVQMKCQKKQNQ